jgi:threonine/homoserine/homoserine lactone efflux protein
MGAGYAAVVVWTFLPIAALLTIAPGPATAMVVRNALRAGWRPAVLTVAGNELGVVVWALLSVLGISALVAASEVAYLALKLVGAGVLIWIGVQSLRRSAEPVEARATSARPFRDGVVTSLSNPKLAVFFVALFPQFIDAGAPVLPATLLMAAMLAIFDFAWYTALAVMVSRARQSFVRSRVGRWVERTTGAILIALGVRVAIEQR